MQQAFEINEQISLTKSIQEEIDDETQGVHVSSCQKPHNDQHIFYSLKTSSFANNNPSIFSVPIESVEMKQSSQSIRIKPRINPRNSLSIKTSLPQNSCESQNRINKINHAFKSASPNQRANKKVQMQNTQMPQIRVDTCGPKGKNHLADNIFDQTFKLKRKNSQKRRNYFNVKELMQFESQRKKDSAVIMLKNTSNSIIKRKKYDILGKVDLSNQKVKQFQFNAIEITKNIVEKSYGKYGAISKRRNQDKKFLLKINNSYNQGLSGQKKQLISGPTRQYFDQKLIDGIYEQRGSLWRSNSYQLPRTKQGIPQKMNRTGSIGTEKNVRSAQFDSNIDLNPWSMGQQINWSHLKTRYAAYKTQNKHQEEEHQFLNYYITSRHQK